MGLSKKKAAGTEDETPQCPQCETSALNRYGRIRSGKQRYLCLVCGRQLVYPTTRRALPVSRPHCPECEKPMHIYARGAVNIRFRCSGYPNCRKYVHMQAADGN